MRRVHGTVVHGVDVDRQTRCAHWNGPNDVVALRMKCCDRWYPCFDCHQTLADHEPEVWSIEERDEVAVMCGVCGAGLSIATYLEEGSVCIRCSRGFNLNCARHHHLYFELGRRDRLEEPLVDPGAAG